MEIGSIRNQNSGKVGASLLGRNHLSELFAIICETLSP